MSAVDLNTLKAYINDIPQLFSLGPEETGKLVYYMGYKEFKKGQVFFNEGDEGDAVYYIIRGSVNILKESVEGRPIKLATIRRDGIIGEMSLIDSAPRSATALAMEDTEAVFFARQKFEALLKNLPAIGTKILLQFSRTMSQRVRFLSGQLADTIHELKDQRQS